MNSSRISRVATLASAVVFGAALALPTISSAALLGVEIENPLLTFNNTGTTSYDATSGAFSVVAQPLAIQLSPTDPPRFINPTGGVESVTLDIVLDSSGNLAGGAAGPDFTVTGEVDLDGDGSVDAAGVLIEGEITGFGFLNADTGETDLYDFTVDITGGELAGLYGSSGGIELTSELSDFEDDFTMDFSGKAKGTLGKVPGSGEVCDLEFDKTCLVVPPPSGDDACTASIVAFTVRYTGPTIPGLSTVEITGDKNGTALYTDVELVSGETVLISPAQNGYSIDAQAVNGDQLGSKTTLTINGIDEIIHTSCSAPFVAGAPAPLNDPKGDPSPNWFVEAFLDKDGNMGTVIDPEFQDNCLIPAPENLVCEKRPTEIQFIYNGGDCSQSDNSQDEDKVDCETFGTVGEPVDILIYKSDNVYADVTGVGVGDAVVASSAMTDRDDFDSEVFVEIRDAGGAIVQELRFHTSCSQPLAIGDRFGSLEVVGFTNEDQGTVAGGTEVIFQYKVTNNGPDTAFDLVVTDTALDPEEVPGSPIDMLAAGEMETLTTSVFVTDSLSGIATVTGATAGGEVCTATDTLEVEVETPPPCIVSGDGQLNIDDDKIEWKITNPGANTITVERIEITFPDEFGVIEKIKLDGDIFKEDAASPAVITSFTGDLKNRQIKSGDTEKLTIEFSDKFKEATADDFEIRVVFEEGCEVEFENVGEPDECNKPIDELTMIWDGMDAPIRVKAYKGDTGDELLLDQDGIGIGDEVVVSGLSGSPNDVFWEIFAGGTKIGESNFHLSCSDGDMQNSSDCGNRQGNGKSNDGDLINDWILEGMVDADGPFDCSELGGGGRP